MTAQWSFRRRWWNSVPQKAPSAPKRKTVEDEHFVPREQIDPDVYRDQIGFAELSFDVDSVRGAIESARRGAG